jgi:hypothetical protein
MVQRQIEEEDEEELLQTMKVENTTPELTHDLESQIQAIRGGGQPLPKSERAFFEPRFGYDFSRVRVHSDAQAAEAARAVNARAFTLGLDVVFGAGQYAPWTTEGQRLLAHELTHVVQQSRGVASGQIFQITSLRIQRVGICAPNECQQGVSRPRDPDGRCAVRGRRCLGCIAPPMEPYESRRDRNSRHYMLWFCPDSWELVSVTPILYERGGTRREVGWDDLCRDLRRWAHRGVRVFGFASPESTGSYRNDWMAAHRAIKAVSDLRTGCALPEGSIRPYLERTNLGPGVTDEFSPNEDNRFVWIEPIPREEPEQEQLQRDEWACHPIGYSTGEVEWLTILPVSSGIFIEKQVVTLAHGPNQASPECNDFRYVGAGSEIGFEDFLILARDVLSLLSMILLTRLRSRLPRQLQERVEERIQAAINALVDRMRDFAVRHWAGQMSTSEWRCWSFRRSLVWDDWQTRGSRQSGPVYYFGSVRGGRSPGGLLRSVPFSFTGLDLPGVGGSAGIYQVPGGLDLIRAAPGLSLLLRALYRRIPEAVFQRMENDGIPREAIESVVVFFESLVRWTTNPNQVDDWTRLRVSGSCNPLRPLDCPLFEVSRLGQ